MKYDNDKPKIHLVPPEAIIEAAKVFGFGAEKYGENKTLKSFLSLVITHLFSVIC
jgi:hypothetical protein